MRTHEVMWFGRWHWSKMPSVRLSLFSEAVVWSGITLTKLMEAAQRRYYFLRFRNQQSWIPKRYIGVG